MQINFSPLKALKIPALLTSIFVIALLAYYYFWVSGKAAYLEGRNFRLLATAGRQIDESIDSQVQVIRSIVQDNETETPEKIKQLAARVSNIDKDELKDEQKKIGLSAPDKVCQTGAKSVQSVHLETEAGHDWVRVVLCGKDKIYRTRFSLNKTLQEIFGETAKAQAFGSVLLAKTGGEVVYQSAATEQKLTRLDKLTPAGSGAAPPAFTALAHATNSFSAEVSGALHHIFLQPCCRSLLASAPAAEAGAASKAAPANTTAADIAGPATTPDKEPEGLVLCGLVSARRMTYGSLEISFTLLALITGVILAAIFSWPFLKLSLIGERQRVQLLDVLLVGSCAVLLLALVTLGGLDATAYADFKEGLAQRLEELARQIKEQTRTEVALDYAQLVELEEQALASKERDARYQASYAPYTQLFLVDEDGQQFRQHAMLPGKENPAINIADRVYFSEVKKDRTWHAPGLLTLAYAPPHLLLPPLLIPVTPTTLPPLLVPVKPATLPALAASFPSPTGGPYVLESIRSWTTGQRRAVLIKPVKLPKNETKPAVPGHAARRSALVSPTGKPPIAAGIGLPLRSLIGPIVPYGFGFAVIEEDGRVIFHSDEQRNLIENFFAEADNDRRLRAAVAAHRAEHVQIRYGGQDYAAFVSPFETLPGPSWHVVTFYDKQLPRTLNVQWLATAVLLLSCYALLFVLFGALVLALRPHYRAPWLWPDQARINRYLLLLALYLIPTLMLGHLIYTNSVGKSLLFGVAWALVAVWALTWAVLWPAPKTTTEEPSWRAPRRSREALISSYAAFWVFHLFLVAVLPTVVFFQIAHRVQTDAYLKHAQLSFASALKQSQARIKEAAAAEQEAVAKWQQAKKTTAPVFIPETRPVAYGAGLLNPPSTAPPDCCDHELLPLVGGLALPGLLEAQSASYSLFSVELKEMSRANNASDGLWKWRRRPPEQRELFLRLETDSAPLHVQTVVPRMITHDSLGNLLLLLATALAVCLLAWWIVRFACLRIFLIDLMPPVWRDARGRLQISGGYHTFIYCRADAQAAQYRTEVVVDFRQWPPADDARDWRVILGERVEGQPLGAPIVLDHFEANMHNADFNGRKLDVVEELIRVHNRTVIILTAAHPAPVFTYFQAPATIGDAQSNGAHARRWEVLSAFSVIDVEALPLASLPAAPAVSAPLADAAGPTPTDGAAAPANGRRSGVAAYLRHFMRQTSALVLPGGRLEDEYRSGLLAQLRDEVAPNGDAASRARALSLDIIEEVNDRAGRYYYQLWAACTPAEKTVLVHLAQDGFLNHEDRRTIRRLMMRGFIVRGPHLRLASVALRRFLLTHTCRAEAAKLAAAPRSAWDSFKWPFIIVLAAVVLFFFATQQELFNATIAVITGVAGAMPVFIRVIGLLLGKRQPEEGAQK